MGIADDYVLGRKFADKARAERESPSVPIMEIVTDHTSPRTIKFRGETVRYIPLSLREEVELSCYEEYPLKACERMLQKALFYDTQRGVINDDEPSMQELKEILEELPQKYLAALYEAILLERNSIGEALHDDYSKYNEESKSENHGLPRKPNPLDEYVGYFSIFKEKSFEEISDMTQVQYIFYRLMCQESNIRQSNDHEHMMKKK